MRLISEIEWKHEEFHSLVELEMVSVGHVMSTWSA